MAYSLTGIDHVQLAMPPGRESEAEAFYAGVLGLAVRPKPEPLAARGGRWFTGAGVQLHLGVDEAFRPAHKAHPAVVVAGLDDLVARLAVEGVAVRWSDELPERRRCYVDDPFGNRIELIEG